MELIPNQLNNCRFVILRETYDPKKEKAPLEVGWTDTLNYSKDEFYKAFKKKYPKRSPSKYGVFCGHNGLVVIDCDEKEFEDACLNNPLFKNTFTCRTAMKGLCHFYFYTDKQVAETIRIDRFIRDSNGDIKIDKRGNEERVRVCDIQGFGTQVVGANSKLINGKKYDIIDESPIKTVKYEELVATCKSLLPDLITADSKKTRNIRKGETKQSDKIKKRYKIEKNDIEEYEKDPVIIYIKSKITIRDLLEEWGINTMKGKNCECPFHDSQNGVCFSYKSHQFNCFHCQRGGSMFDLVMEKEECSFLEAKEILATKVGIPEKVIKEADFLISKAKKADATEHLVHQFMEHNHIYVPRNKKEEVWIYNNGIVIPYGDTYIRQFCRAMLGSYYTDRVANSVLKKIIADSYVDEEDFFNPYNPFEVPVKNGILNILTRELKSFDPTKIFFQKIPVFFNKEVGYSEKIIKFLESTLKYKEDVYCIQEMFGYTLWKECKLKKSFLLVGGGDNGKSAVLDLYTYFIGTENVSNVSLQELDSSEYAPYNLHGKLANVDADIGHTKLNESARFKKLVAGDELSVNRKHLDFIKFKNYAKLMYACNKIPETEDKTEGFFTRWSILDFPYTFVKQEKFDKYTEEERKELGIKLANKNVLDELQTEIDMTGMLNWIMDGFKRIYETKEFTRTPAIKDVRRYWNRKESTFKAFMEDMVEVTYNNKDFVRTSDLNIAYCKYCEDNKLKIETVKQRSIHMSSYPTSKSRRWIYNKETEKDENANVYTNIRLKIIKKEEDKIKEAMKNSFGQVLP